MLAMVIAGVLTVCGLQAPIPRFGPGLPDGAPAAIDLGVLTPTDVTLPPESSVTASTTKVKNVVLGISWSTPYIVGLNFTFTPNYSNTTLSGYWISDITDIDRFALTENGSSLTMDYYYDESIVGTIFFEPVLYCIYNTTGSVANGKSINVTFNSGTYDDGTSVRLSDLDYEIIKFCLGDVDENGVINDTDATRALQIATNTLPSSVTISATGRLAADVNFDGVVNAHDALKIQQYNNSTIYTFLSPADSILPLPTTQTANIVSGNTYRIGNFETGRHLAASNGTATSGCGLRYYNSSSQRTDVVITHAGSGRYTIKSGYNNQLLGLSSAYSATFNSSDQIANSHLWYIIPYENGLYKIVNYATPQKMLTSGDRASSSTSIACTASRLYNGSRWFIHQNEAVTINYYYDYGYQALDPVDTAATLRTYQLDIATVLNNLYGITVSTAYPIRFYSLGDRCYASTTAITAANVDEACSHCSTDICNGYLNSTTPNTAGTNVHHKNGSACLRYMYNQLQDKTNPQTIHILTTGYDPCGLDKSTGQHVPRTCAGLAVASWRVGAVFCNDPENGYYSQSTALHEISHNMVLLANDDDNSITDTNHGQCVMSYDKSNSQLVADWREGKFGDLYCDDCKSEIIRYLYQHSAIN